MHRRAARSLGLLVFLVFRRSLGSAALVRLAFFVARLSAALRVAALGDRGGGILEAGFRAGFGRGVRNADGLR